MNILFKAIRDNEIHAVRNLVEVGADIEKRDVEGDTALIAAAAYPLSGLEITKYLVEEKGADINAVNKDNKTALYRAAYNNKLEVVKFLVEKGADVNIKTFIGNSPLDIARTAGSLEVVEFLESIILEKPTREGLCLWITLRNNL